MVVIVFATNEEVLKSFRVQLNPDNVQITILERSLLHFVKRERSNPVAS